MAKLSAVILELKLRKIGNALGLALPQEALAHLGVKEGDTICVSTAADGSLRITPADPEGAQSGSEGTQPSLEVRRQLEAAQNLVDRYRKAVSELDT